MKREDNLSERKLYTISFLIIFMLVIYISLIKYKEVISQVMSSFIIEKVTTNNKDSLMDNRKKIRYKHLSIYYATSDEQLLPYTEKSLNRAMELNDSLFGIRYTKPYDFIIFRDRTEIETFSGLEHAIGIHSPAYNVLGVLPENKEEIIANIGPQVWNYQSNIIHEYTHYVFIQKIAEVGLDNTDFPLWFLEGIAEYLALDNLNGRPLEVSNVIPLNELITSEQWNKYRTETEYDIYLQSEKTIYTLVDKFGPEIINKIIHETGKKKNFQEGFESATNTSIMKLDEHIRNNKGL